MSDLRLPPVDIHPLVRAGDSFSKAPEAPLPVQEHMDSLSTLVGSAISRGAIGPNAAAYLHEFAIRHDAGYATDINILRTDEAQAILHRALGGIDSSVHPSRVTEYLFENQHNYLAARVIGHGVLGLIDNTLHYQAQGIPFNRAFGLANVMATHHPGFPITMVSGFVSGTAAIREHERSSFFIDDNGDDAEVMRAKLITVAAEHLRIPVADVARIAVLGYAFDRITPGKTPAIVRIKEDGATQVRGGEVIQKKYGLVAGDLLADETVAEPSISALYATVIERLRAEASAAIKTAAYAHQDDLVSFITREAQGVIAQTQREQTEAATQLKELGLSGAFGQLETERSTLLHAARKSKDPRTLYALASYDAVIPRVA